MHDSKYRGVKMTLANIIKQLSKKIILPATVLGAMWFGGNALAEEPARSQFDGYARARTRCASGISGNLENLGINAEEFGFMTDGRMLYKPVPEIKITADWDARWTKYLNENENARDAEVSTHKAMIGAGFYPTKNKEFDLFLQGQIGGQATRYAGAVDYLRSDRFLLGGRAEANIRKVISELGSRWTANLNIGTDDGEYKLHSGYEDHENFGHDVNKFFIGLDGLVGLLHDGKRVSRNIGEEYEAQLNAGLSLFFNYDKLATYTLTQSWGGRLTVQGVLNGGKGKNAWKLGMFIDYQQADGSSDISRRTAQTQITTAGLRGELKMGRLVLFAELGGRGYLLSVDDPGRNYSHTSTRPGMVAEFGAYATW